LIEANALPLSQTANRFGLVVMREVYVSIGPPTGGCEPLSIFIKFDVWNSGSQ